MGLNRENGVGLIWFVVLIAVVVAMVAGYFLYQANSPDNESINNPETITEQQKEKTEEKKDEAKTGKIITTGDSEFGTILFDDRGQAIYIWELEESSEAECYGSCAVAWPPVLTNGAPQAMGAVKSELLGTTERTDGSTQITYNGHPLYYYAHEEAGEVKCHNVSTHGGLWWVIKPNGIRAE